MYEVLSLLVLLLEILVEFLVQVLGDFDVGVAGGQQAFDR